MNPTQCAGLEIRKAGNEVLVHDPAGGQVHVLNEVAGRILELCDGTRPQAQISAAIVAETNADAAIVEPDVAAILERFRALGLLEGGG
jgi:PqqD family protein of HPr-rel-A system